MTIREHQKRHSNAWDAVLTDEQRDQVFRAATSGGLSWESIAKWAAKEFKIAPPKRDAFYSFVSYWRPQYVARRVQEKLLARDALREQRKQVGDMSPELADSLEEQGSALISSGQLDAAKIIFDIAAKIRDDVRRRLEIEIRRTAEARADKDIQIKLRRLELMERKLTEATETGKPVDPKALADEVDRILGRKK